MKDSNYSEINFDAFISEDNDRITEIEKDTLKSNFYESVGLTRAETKRPRAMRGFSRRIIVVAATMVIVLAFGAVAYATDFFGLGKTKHYDVVYESPFREDSNQFKAQNEYEEYIASLSESEREADSEEWLKIQNEISESDENMWESRKTLPVGYTKAENKAITRISKKYGLKMNKNEYYTTSINDAFSKTNVPNFMGSSMKIINSMVSEEFVDDGGFICGDAGTLSMGLGNGLCDISVYPSDVFPGVPEWSDENPTGSDKDQTSEQWIFTTNDGLKVKTEMTSLRKINGYYFVYGTDDYTMTFRMMRFGNSEAHKDMPIPSKSDFEELINSFDLNKL